MSNDDIAREILVAGRYVVLATADADGVPWSSPVWFATEDCRELYWVSHPEARHSRNIAVRPRIALTVFDSTVEAGHGQAVYMSATAEQLVDPAAVERGLAVFSAEAAMQELGDWGVDRISGPARLRLYRANVDEHWILDPDSPYDVRVSVSP